MKIKVKCDDDYIEVDTEFPDEKVDYAVMEDEKNKLEDTLELKITGDNDE